MYCTGQQTLRAIQQIELSSYLQTQYHNQDIPLKQFQWYCIHKLSLPTEGKSFLGHKRRQVFISLCFQIIFPLPENPIKGYGSHFSFVTEAKTYCLQRSMFSRCQFTLLYEKWLLRKSKHSLQKEKSTLNFLSNGFLQTNEHCWQLFPVC